MCVFIFILDLYFGTGTCYFNELRIILSRFTVMRRLTTDEQCYTSYG